MTCFWLAVLFRLTTAAPRVVRVAKPLLVRLAWLASPAVRRATAVNGRRLAPAMPPRRFGLAVLGHFYDFVADVGRPPRTDAVVTGTDHYRAARALHRGAVLVTAHMGSFEAGLAAVPPDERQVHVVFKRDAVPVFDAVRRRLRDRLNVAEAAIDDGLPVWLGLRDALRRDEVVAIQADRALPGQSARSVAVANGHLHLPVGPYKLAMLADAPVIPIFAHRRPDGRIGIDIRPAITVVDISTAVDLYAAELSAQLQSHPTQWLVLHPAFEEDAPCPAS